MFKTVDAKRKYSEMEGDVLKFWKENKIFEKSVEQRGEDKLYSFYDGPPFATGEPHYGHIVGSTMKDVVPRYWAMKGFRVERRWGWDCHGLPIENIAEKDLGIHHKKEIEELGVEKFNETCRTKVLSYVEEWEKVIDKLGRWADMKNGYKTMDLDYMESVWWVFKQLYDKGLIYEGYRSMHICPRCETTLSQTEVSEGYKDIKDLSVIAEFRLIDDEKTSILAWTTTPWTLIGNVALAVGSDIDYVKIEKKDEGTGGLVCFILAKEKLENLFEGQDYKIIEEFKGAELVGKAYRPLFGYYSNQENLENRENGWKVCAGNFVTTEDGTGIVHIAPAFGEDDMNLGKENNLPFVQHVGMDGIIKKEAMDFVGLSVKPLGDHQKTDVEIIKYLAHNNLLFSKEKFEHSYPHCWRCDTPLINYATSSWFVAITKIKEKMLENAKILNWEPSYIKEGRWGNWLEGARDWSISRQRYWASVMPIWKCECGEIKVIGSVKELEEQKDLGIFYVMRHGEAGNNVERVLSCKVGDGKFLTEKGVSDVNNTAEKLVDKKIDLIISSDIDRTKQTSEIVAKKLGVEIIYDSRLRETDTGDYNGVKIDDIKDFVDNWENGCKESFPNGDSWENLGERMENFYNDIFSKYRGKKILVVSHGDLINALEAKFVDGNYLDNVKAVYQNNYINKAELREKKYKIIDLHKHIVDKITFPCEKCGKEMKRIPDVLDTWFDSGSMPYAQAHYPFENKEKFEKSFPAEFIAEGIDQTRAWFYYLHAIATGIFDKEAFRNVIVNGIVLAEDGKKMSKRLKNYPDPTEMIEKYGADVLRFYLLYSPVVRAQNLNFSEKDLAEFSRGMFRMIQNSYSFFVLYANIDKWSPAEKTEPKNLLDKWLLSELNMLIRDVDLAMENYELNKAVRLFPQFVDNLSNWYIRRSRRRFWKSESDEDKNNAYQTLWTVLTEFSKVLAPFCPFISEEIYRNLTGEESVHLCDFPVADEKLIDEKLNANMGDLREIITLGLQDRAKNKIKVRQPLKRVFLGQKYMRVFEELINETEWSNILTEELNVKGAELGTEIETITVDIEVTPELRLEGQMRELIRHIQQARKEADFQIDDRIDVFYEGGAEIFGKTELYEEIKKEVLAKKLEKVGNEKPEADIEKEARIDDLIIRFWLKK